MVPFASTSYYPVTAPIIPQQAQQQPQVAYDDPYRPAASASQPQQAPYGQTLGPYPSQNGYGQAPNGFATNGYGQTSYGQQTIGGNLPYQPIQQAPPPPQPVQPPPPKKPVGGWNVCDCSFPVFAMLRSLNYVGRANYQTPVVDRECCCKGFGCTDLFAIPKCLADNAKRVRGTSCFFPGPAARGRNRECRPTSAAIKRDYKDTRSANAAAAVRVTATSPRASIRPRAWSAWSYAAEHGLRSRSCRYAATTW